ncbi:uncharacterized protein N7518_006293 [Penicillium psychrosexuale]|uniref:uncharacterized protein n=1 Tax=Penicillium psychrosexuale TaxID=1002107 RepID=UPI00254578F5|nr:uncharacterized protein N7518_006293 [Penicillium psychrosexuale]KAJ5789282.1 hypothetical protein N7518_006293 [Penicillium psychrosexuale]
MLRARRAARQGAPAQDPRYAQSGGRSRYRERRQGYPPEQYSPGQDQYGHPQQQQHSQTQQHGAPQPQWPEELYNPRQMYGPPQQYVGQQPPTLPPSELYAPNELEAQYARQQPPSELYAGNELEAHHARQQPPSELYAGNELEAQRFNGENMSPFARVRVPELEHQISSDELIVFIDELNEAFLANPALQAANNAANVGGMAPSMIVQMVSMGVNVVAGVGSSVTTKVHTKKYLAKANEELFHPKGLHVQMCKTDKMLEYVGLGGQENVFVRQQYQDASESNNHPIMQRMSLLGNRVMSLSFNNVKEPTMPDGFWKKWGAKEASKVEQKQNEKMIKDQARQDRRSGRRGGRGTSRRQERQEKKKTKEANKILWIVIAAKEESAGGDDEWDSESESSRSHT